MNILSNDISLAQWSLIEEFRAGKWKTLDFPGIARKDFDLNGVELVNTLFEVPTEAYFKTLKSNANDHGVALVLIMCDDEGDGASPAPKERKQFGVNHQKWIEIAHYLGCGAIRTNCRGPQDVDGREALKWAVDSYLPLIDYAAPLNIKVLIENHGGVSNDPDWMIQLMKAIDHPLFGTYPDWREPSPDFDNHAYLEKTLPFAGGMSYRNQPTEALTARMIRLSQDAGYRGWYGIESNGREAIAQGITWLRKYLF